MYFPLFVSRRYLLSKKKHNAINLISAISAFGVMGGSMAFIFVMSIFNGFEGVVLSLFNSFHPDIRITATLGKTFILAEQQQERIKEIPGIIHYNEVIEEVALLRYKDKQHIATLKGVSDGYENSSGLDTMIYIGDFILETSDIVRGVVGAGIAYKLGSTVNDFNTPVEVYMPSRTARPGTIIPAFHVKKMFPAGIFSIQQDIDNRYSVVPIGFMRKLLEYDNEVTSVELAIDPSVNKRVIKSELKSILGDDFIVEDRFEQQQLLYKIIRSERWFIFAILSFILLLAIFNIIGCLTMLILEKKKDIAVLRTMGATNRTIREIFLFKGLQISFFGVISGLILGGVVAWLQQQIGFITIGQAETLVIDSYPVKLFVTDFILIFITVMAIGALAAWLPVRRLSKKYVDFNL